SSAATLLHSASAVLASRADTPTRKPPVTSFKSAQRPVASSASSQRSNRAPAVARVAASSSATIADKIVGPGEQLAVDPAGGERTDLRRLHFGERQLAGQRRQRPAALGIVGG